MSTKRRGSTPFSAFWPDPGPAADGRSRCRYCRRPLDAPRRDWCSDACASRALHEFSLHNDPAYQRRAVYARDGGVCAQCGRDTKPLRRRLQAVPPAERARRFPTLLQAGYDRYRLERLILWEMDHVVAVVEGGGGQGLDNLQTLCVPCHKRKTAALRRRRRDEQHGQQDLFG